jgi:hypothetical protein
MSFTIYTYTVPAKISLHSKESFFTERQKFQEFYFLPTKDKDRFFKILDERVLYVG